MTLKICRVLASTKEQHGPDDVVADGPAEALAADAGDLAQAKGRMLCLQLNDRALEFGGERSMGPRRRLQALSVEEAAHAELSAGDEVERQRAWSTPG